jgi:hypothetical protein
MKQAFQTKKLKWSAINFILKLVLESDYSFWISPKLDTLFVRWFDKFVDIKLRLHVKDLRHSICTINMVNDGQKFQSFDKSVPVVLELGTFVLWFKTGNLDPRSGTFLLSNKNYRKNVFFHIFIELFNFRVEPILVIV